MVEHQIVGSGPLLDAQGCLREPGYAFRPPFEYSHDTIDAPKWRIKDWDYYLISDAAYAVALTFSDLGYIGLVSAAVLDLADAVPTTTSELVVLPLGKMGLPASSEEGDVFWSNKRCNVSFAHVSGGRRLSFSMKNFSGDDDLEVEVFLDREPRDSMNIVTPWEEDPTAF